MAGSLRKQQRDTRRLDEATKELKKGEIYYAQVETILPTGQKDGNKIMAGRQRIIPSPNLDQKGE